RGQQGGRPDQGRVGGAQDAVDRRVGRGRPQRVEQGGGAAVDAAERGVVRHGGGEGDLLPGEGVGDGVAVGGGAVDRRRTDQGLDGDLDGRLVAGRDERLLHAVLSVQVVLLDVGQQEDAPAVNDRQPARRRRGQVVVGAGRQRAEVE